MEHINEYLGIGIMAAGSIGCLIMGVASIRINRKYRELIAEGETNI